MKISIVLSSLQRLCCAVSVSVLMVSPAAAASNGSAMQTIQLLDKAFELYLYQPQNCVLRGHLLVFHGVERNASDYRDRAMTIADKYCFNVYVPLFSKTDFPKSKYQEGGWNEAGAKQGKSISTTQYGLQLIRWVEKNASQANSKIYLLGHSAGAQYLSRLAAFETLPNSVQRVVIANPSTWVWPSTEMSVPYGFKGFDEPNKGLVEYLRKPITVYLGGADTGNKNLAMTPEANRQGENRLVRGKGAYAAAEKVAKQSDVGLTWRLVVASGVDHNSERMFAASEMGVALGLAAKGLVQ
jgi:dienelactone hydrolase